MTGADRKRNPKNEDHEKFSARRVKKPDGSVAVLPPIGHGDAWSGGGPVRKVGHA